MTPKVAIIGAGPAGLLAAYAVRNQGCEATIYAPEVREAFLGAQVLHRCIPGLTSIFADGMAHIAKWGQEPIYRTKVYGSVDLDGPTSWDEYNDMLRIWNLTDANRTLLGRLRDRIVIRRVVPRDIVMIGKEFDAIINTAPAQVFCTYPGLHAFPSVQVRLTEGAQDGVQHNQIVYNGTRADRWYRSSRLFGFGSTEWPGDTPIVGGTLVHKPLWTDCDCHLGPGYYRAGRYGRWSKGVLSHDGFETGIEAAHALLALQ